MRRFFITPEAISGNRAVIQGQEARHLATVLRLVPGDTVELVDGKGTMVKAEIETISPQNINLVIIEESSTKSESPVHITIAQGMLKDKKMDMLIRHLTELGICEWIPFVSSRSIPKPDSKRLMARMERWNKIAMEALKQCGRSVVPIIGKSVQFTEILEMGSDFDQKIAFWENAATPIACAREHGQKHGIEPPKRIIVMIGPEGGFSKEEIEAAKENGFTAYSLGPRILRAETASITAATLVQHFFGDLGKNIS